MSQNYSPPRFGEIDYRRNEYFFFVIGVKKKVDEHSFRRFLRSRSLKGVPVVGIKVCRVFFLGPTNNTEVPSHVSPLAENVEFFQ